MRRRSEAGNRPLYFLVSLPANDVPNRSHPVRQWRDENSAPNRRRFSGRLQQANDLGRRDPPHNRVHRSVTHDPVLIDNEDCRLSDTAFLACIADIPILDDAPLRIAQNRKRQRKLSTHALGRCRRIYRDGYYACGRRPDFRVVVSVVRQLAEAERSPIAAIEE